MATVLLKLEKQLLTVQNREIISAGDINVDKCKFEFDSYWNGYARTAVFYRQKDKTSFAMLNNTGECIIPAEVLTVPGTLYIGVFGTKDASILTSTVETIELLEGSVSGTDIDMEPSQSIFLSIVAQYQAMNEKMVKYVSLMEETQITVTEFQEYINGIVEQQNSILNTLNAFEVLQFTQEIETVKMDNNAIKQELEDFRLRSFTIPNATIMFTNNRYIIEDSRIAEDSLIDVFYSNDSFNAATEANIIAESKAGFIQFLCDKAPTLPLSASIVVRTV